MNYLQSVLSGQWDWLILKLQSINGVDDFYLNYHFEEVTSVEGELYCGDSCSVKGQGIYLTPKGTSAVPITVLLDIEVREPTRYQQSG